MSDKHKKAFFDPFLEKNFPTIALKRTRARVEMQLANWAGASTRSPGLSNFFPGISDVDSSLLWERQELVNRSRDHVRNVPVARGVIDRICDHAIGEKGLMLHPKIDAKILGLDQEDAISWQEQTAARWRLYAESKESDHHRRINTNKKGYLTLQSQLEGGDCFTLFLDYMRNGSPFSLKTQTIESEFVSNKNYEQNTETLFDGIEKDSNGIPKRIWISDVHPGNAEALAPSKWVSRNFYSANGNPLVLQHYNQIRPNQSRGIPVLGTVTNKLLNLNKYSDSELLAAVINSYYTIVIKGPKDKTHLNKKSPGSQSTQGADDKYQMGTGSFLRIEEDVDLTPFDPKRPSKDFGPFFLAMIAEIGAALGVPRSLILMLFDKSYSASRGEVILAWMTFLKYRTMTAVGFYQPTYERFLDLEISNGNIAAPGYFENPMIKKAYRGSAYHQWSGPIREAIDELKSAKANEVYNNLKVKSKKQITEEISSADWEQVNNQITHENDLIMSSGGQEDSVSDNDLIEAGLLEEE